MQTILLTGGSGSFGTAYIGARLADAAWDGRIVALARNSEMRWQLGQRYPDPRLDIVPGDVRIAADLDAALSRERLAGTPVETVVHAAAEKHIGTGEAFAPYVWSVNYHGARNVIDAARRFAVARVLALSTDKATDDLANDPPANEYGKSKQAAERAFIAANMAGPTRFALVRYGNVLGSSGSVVPLFVRQRENGRLTITDRRMTRFAMPLDDAASNGLSAHWWHGARVLSAVGLVQRALALMAERPGAGFILVPHIPSHSVADLAAQIGPDCRLVEIGIRPGERLHEILISPSEAERTWRVADDLWAILETPRAQWRGGERVPPGFAFTSADDPLPVRLEWAA